MLELPSLRELEVFRATISAGSATSAAQRLGISQPSVSRALAQIEQRVGMILFLRQNGRLVPTAEALALNNELEDVFESLDRVRRFAVEADASRAAGSASSPRPASAAISSHRRLLSSSRLTQMS